MRHLESQKKRRNNRGWVKAAFKLLFFAFLGFSSMVMIGIFGFLIYMNQGLPPIDSLKDYRPKEVSQVFSNDGELIGEFFEERRIVQKEIPELVKNAFIAAEDALFWTHPGVDFFGIARAAYKNLSAGGFRQGASTITQQVARGFLLTAEKTMTRKVKEIILAWKIEQSLSKQEIIHLYLNHIYLGRGAYGVAAAAEVYFGKKLYEITLAEAAILGGLPQAPSRYNPQRNPDRVKRRQLYVLRQMLNEGFINREQHDQAAAETIYIAPRRDLNKEVAPYFVEFVRQRVMEKYGSRMVLQDGLKIYTTVDIERSRAADNALRTGLSALEERQGYRGPKRRLKFDTEIEQYFEGRKFDEKDDESDTDQSLEVAQSEITGKGRILMSPRPPLSVGDFIEGVVTRVSDEQGEAFVEYEPGYFARLQMAGMKWAHKRISMDDEEGVALAPERPSQILQVGDVVQVTVKSLNVENGTLEKLSSILLGKSPRHQNIQKVNLIEGRLEQSTEVEGAVFAVDPRNGFVLAMTGGFDFKRSEFNRALQAKRQPGSAFKPIVYTAALDLGFTPASILQDTPLTFENAIDESKWRPNNYDGEFEGDITVRTSLLKSKNIPTIRLLNELGLDVGISYARRLGVTSNLNRDFTLALGSSDVTLAEMVKPYVVFATGGYPRDYIFIRRIVDRDGKILEENVVENFDAPPVEQIDRAVRQIKQEASAVVFSEDVPKTDEAESGASFLKDTVQNKREELSRPRLQSSLAPGQVLASETAYLMTHLLKENVLFGSGRRSRESLKRPAAGKTGTTDDNMDAWFIGFTPEVVAGVWVGYDEKKRLGRQETGSTAAVPIWTDFMAAATQGLPQSDFVVPPNIEFARIDPKTGGPATAKTRGAVFEAFIKGSVPTLAPETQKDPVDLYQRDDL